MVFLGNTLLFGQTGKMKGCILDDQTEEALLFANVLLKQNGNVIMKTISDEEGNYSFSDVLPGIYDLDVRYIGYDPGTMRSLVVSGNKTTYADVKSKSSDIVLAFCEIIGYSEPLIDWEYSTCRSTNCCFGCCCGITSCVYFTIAGDSISEEKKVAEDPAPVVLCKAFPNPFVEYVTFELNLREELSRDEIVKLYDLNGKEVRRVNFSGNSAQIDRGDMSDGIYVYRVSREETTLAEGKLVLQK